jgi:DNA-binding NarL/FixJ family response regulator
VARLVGDFALVAGRPAEAAAHYRAGASMNARIGARPFTALSRLGLAHALVELGYEHDPATREPVSALIEQAGAEFSRLDMPGPLRAAAGLAERTQSVRSGSARYGSHSPLTSREQEVADLVAQGMANKAVAQRLYLSERTVETHVRNILAKLSLTSRNEIAAWILRR